MTLLIPPAPPVAAARAAEPGRALARRAALLLALGWLGQVCVRLWFARARTGPVADPDETGYLAAARWLAGGPGADLSGNTFYQVGYPLLLTPLRWVTHDPATLYTLVMVLNALVASAVFPLGYLAARRLGLGVPAALPLAWAAALLPAVTFFDAFALADAVLPVVVLGWLLLLDRFARGGRAGDAVAASLVAAYASTIHTRGTILLAVHVAALVLLALRDVPWLRRPALRGLWRRPGIERRQGASRGTRRRAMLERQRGSGRRTWWLPTLEQWRGASCGVWWRACVGIAVAVAGYAAGAALNGMLRAELYPGGTRDLGANIVDRVTSLEGQARALSGAAGQIWYLAVSTWGLGGVGLVAAVAVLARRRTPASTRLMAAALLALTFGIAYASAAALADEHRVGNFAYGRYLSCLALVHTLVGLAVLVRAGLRTAVRASLAAGAVIALAGTAVVAYAGGRLRTHKYIAFDFPETGFLTGSRTELHLVGASLAACGLLAAFLVARRFGWPALTIGLAGVSLAATTFAMGPSPARAAPVSPLPGAASGGVVSDPSLPWFVHVKLVQPVWWTRVTVLDVRRAPLPEGTCSVALAPPPGTAPEASWPGHPAGWRAHPRESFGASWTVWRNPRCADD
ncbi:hypothetical protein [Actinomadura hibisca]|uniref:hypothetical protein n=1 Tax=Actinomadura hibisca TaxID=68565 RepID=UPI000836AAC2|nr:hypothetical protein [Actinomadura hibisca]